MESYRKDGKIVIEIMEKAIEVGLHLLPGNVMGKITDREKFLNFIAENICDFDRTGNSDYYSQMTVLIDDLITEAIESDAGIEC